MEQNQSSDTTKYLAITKKIEKVADSTIRIIIVSTTFATLILLTIGKI